MSAEDNKEAPPDIMMFCDAGYDIEQVASAYIQQFNKLSRFNVVEWSARNPTDQEIEHAKQHQLDSGVDKVEKAGEKWFAIRGEEKKRLFVLVINRYQKLPQHLYESKMKNLEVTPIEVAPKDDEQNS